MYPYFTLWGTKFFMTGIGIVVAFVTFVSVVYYLSKRYLQGFWKFFYWLPIFIFSSYFLGSYVQFILSNQLIFPHSFGDFLQILSPYGYKFHFVGILLGFVFSLRMFLKKVPTFENKKIWTDIFFFAFALATVPLGIFLFFGDNFVGWSTSGILGVSSLHSESQRNKFTSVLPIGIFLAVGSLLIALFVLLKRRITRISLRHMRYGILGFALLLTFINIILIFQQYPRYVVFSLGPIQLDIKQHLSFFVIMRCIYLHKKWNAPKLVIE